MRMMLTILIPTAAGNEAVKDGSLAKLFETTICKLDPETNYFVAQDGLRCAMIFFDIRIAPSFHASSSCCFMGVNAELEEGARCCDAGSVTVRLSVSKFAKARLYTRRG